MPNPGTWWLMGPPLLQLPPHAGPRTLKVLGLRAVYIFSVIPLDGFAMTNMKSDRCWSHTGDLASQDGPHAAEDTCPPYTAGTVSGETCMFLTSTLGPFEDLMPCRIWSQVVDAMRQVSGEGDPFQAHKHGPAAHNKEPLMAVLPVRASLRDSIEDRLVRGIHAHMKQRRGQRRR